MVCKVLVVGITFSTPIFCRFASLLSIFAPIKIMVCYRIDVHLFLDILFRIDWTQ